MTATEIILMGEEREYWLSKQEDVTQAQRETGHKFVQSYYQALMALPRNNRGEISECANHVSQLEMLDSMGGNMYYSEEDEFYVDEWSIQTPELYHRHKELGTYITADGMAFQGYAPETAAVDYPKHYQTHVQWDSAGGKCGLCLKEMPGEIMMMHKFYQLP